ncbi:MAG: hypothetical protein KF742_03520 [Cryobacterium sp.]|nr:hypothetical protein [Cryobacterium sp.]MBX3089179.1 hypothetical protein [Cryobacterium sp.]MCC7128187.1 hypothetical protein [Microbacteriaceae bacterium]MCO5294386.1 hypothetical protein [Homoserinimonas sp.]
MAESLRPRPVGSQVVFQSSAHLRVRPQKLFESIRRRLNPGENAASLFHADPAGLRVITQGGGWYRAEYQLVPDETGCLIEHALLDTSRRVGDPPRSVQKVIEDAPESFDQLVEVLKAELE